MTFCSKCGNELQESSVYCSKCANLIIKPTSNPSMQIYLLPIFIGILGGFWGWYVMRKDDSKIALNCIIIGFIVSIIWGIIFYASSSVFLFLVNP